MGGILDWLNPIKGLADAATGIIDELSTTDEEAAQAKARLMEAQQEAAAELYDARARIVESQRDVIQAEAESDHWLAANVRPITLFAFVLVALYAGIFAPIFGLPAPMLGEIPDKAWTVIMIGLGGYIGGRSAEKIIPRSKWGSGGASADTDEVVTKVLNTIGDARSE